MRNIITKLGRLHYEIKLDDGRIWKRHIDQIKNIGKGSDSYMRFCDLDHNGSNNENDIGVLEKDTEVSVLRDFKPERSRCSNNTETTESEEGGTTQADLPHALVSPQANAITNEP